MEITAWAKEHFLKSLWTVHRAICKCRLKLYNAKKKPYEKMIHKHCCLLWAKAHLKWTEAMWKTVLWSDKWSFEIIFVNHGLCNHLACYPYSVERLTSPMVCGCISAYWTGNLRRWKVDIKAERYMQVLEQHNPIQMTSLSGKALHISARRC